MNGNWSQKELQRLCVHYQEETGTLDFQPAVIAKWAKGRGYDMPVPPTDVELLTYLLTKAALSERRKDRKDRKIPLLYRANLVFRKLVKGEWRKLYFDADGPAATFDKIMESFHSRRELALKILASAAATVEHFFRTHPTQERVQLDLGIPDAEVRWRLLGPPSDEIGEEKAG